MKIALKIAQLSQEIAFDSLGEEVRDRTKYLLLDYLGVAIRGSLTESSQMVHRFLARNHSPAKGIPVIATDLKAEAPFAALAEGTAAHSLELDDVVNSASLHPAVTVMSAALSAGCLGSCSGKELIEGIVAGYELTIKLGVALDPSAHYAQGFHPTATCGTLGTALAAAKILKIGPQGMVNALGIAGSQAAGLMEFLADGSFTKRFHGGWAAHSGLIAALLAREGFTGPASIIEGRHGFLHAYSSASKTEKVLAGWGEPYEVLKTSIKPHACCRYKQGPIDCILKIIRENGLTEGDIAKITVHVLEAGKAIVAEPREVKLDPRTIVDAQFSMPFGAAVAVIQGQAFLDEYSQENLSSARVRELMKRVECVTDPELEKEFPRKWPAKVEITANDGRTFQARSEFPKGDPENPLSWEEIIDKFNSLAGAVFPPERCAEIVRRVRNLEEEAEVGSLVESLAG